jgi:hypothetical protein
MKSQKIKKIAFASAIVTGSIFSMSVNAQSNLFATVNLDNSGGQQGMGTLSGSTITPSGGGDSI